MSDTRLLIGDKAPDFTLSTSDGSQLSLKDVLEEARHGVVIYFYPKAMTPGCTTQACDFRDNLAYLSSMGYRVIGISPDPVQSLEKFETQENLGFTLCSDPDHHVAHSYAAWGEKKNYGRVYEGLIRSTFVLNTEGKVEIALYNVRAKGHVDRVIREIEGLGL